MNYMTEIDPNPRSDIQSGFERTASDPSGYWDLLKSCRSVKFAPFAMGDNIVTSMRVLVLAHFEVFPPAKSTAAEATLWSRSRDESYFKGLVEREQDNLIVAARDHLGTHTGKVPNPSVSGPGGLFADPDVFSEASGSPFVSSATFKSRQRIGAAGNAAQGKAQRFLASRISFKGELIDVSQSIAEKGLVYSSMLKLGFERGFMDDLADVLSGRLSGTLGDDAPGQYAKGLIWPTEAGDTVITPVHCYAMHVEFAARIKERVAANARLRTTHIVVGGSKPQNAGLINSDMGGWHRMLVSHPPELRSTLDRSVARIGHTGKADLGYISKAVSKDLVAILDAHSFNNQAARQVLDRRIEAIVRLAIEPLQDIYNWCCSNEDFRAEAADKLPSELKALVFDGFAKMPHPKAFVNDVVSHIETSIRRELDQALRGRFRLCVNALLERLFEGV